MNTIPNLAEDAMQKTSDLHFRIYILLLSDKITDENFTDYTKLFQEAYTQCNAIKQGSNIENNTKQLKFTMGKIAKILPLLKNSTDFTPPSADTLEEKLHQLEQLLPNSHLSGKKDINDFIQTTREKIRKYKIGIGNINNNTIPENPIEYKSILKFIQSPSLPDVAALHNIPEIEMEYEDEFNSSNLNVPLWTQQDQTIEKIEDTLQTIQKNIFEIQQNLINGDNFTDQLKKYEASILRAIDSKLQEFQNKPALNDKVIKGFEESLLTFSNILNDMVRQQKIFTDRSVEYGSNVENLEEFFETWSRQFSTFQEDLMKDANTLKNTIQILASITDETTLEFKKATEKFYNEANIVSAKLKELVDTTTEDITKHATNTLAAIDTAATRIDQQFTELQITRQPFVGVKSLVSKPKITGQRRNPSKRPSTTLPEHTSIKTRNVTAQMPETVVPPTPSEIIPPEQIAP